VGASVHNALAAWWRLPEEERSAESAGTLLARGWMTDGFRDDAQSAEWRDRAREMVERYVARLDPADEPIGVERTVATRTDRIAVSGRIDRLDIRGTELVVVDYKTGRHVLTSDDARGSLQLAIYAMAAARVLRRPCRRVELHHLPSGEVAVWEHTDESLQRHLRRAEQIAAEAAAADDAYRSRLKPQTAPPPSRSAAVPRPRPGDGAPVDHAPYDEVFPPRTSNLCSYCDFARHCPEGLRAAPRKEPWAALPTG
jgi:hypothetical protein